MVLRGQLTLTFIILVALLSSFVFLFRSLMCVLTTTNANREESSSCPSLFMLTVNITVAETFGIVDLTSPRYPCTRE